MGLRVRGEDAGGGVDQPLAVVKLVLDLVQGLEVDAVNEGGAGEGAEELGEHVVRNLSPRKFPCKEHPYDRCRVPEGSRVTMQMRAPPLLHKNYEERKSLVTSKDPK